jgi:rare lipoprotein A
MRAFLAAMALCAGVTIVQAETGLASVYGYGRLTASGEHFDPAGLTAAMRRLDGLPVPFGTLVKVCRLPSGSAPGNCILVRINDRGPYVRGRIIDLTPTGANALGFSGLARVTVDVLSLGAVHAAHVHHRPRHRVVRR